eukprot:365096-Chlamydomonas_euryale.AAC.6
MPPPFHKLFLPLHTTHPMARLPCPGRRVQGGALHLRHPGQPGQGLHRVAAKGAVRGPVQGRR